jgi:hypothetical protein
MLEVSLREREKPERQATILFLIDEENQKIWLAKKKRGFGKGKFNGYGGKPNEEDRTIEETAIRETGEESGGVIVEVEDLIKVGVIDFYFPESNKQNNQTAHIYIAKKYKGTPQETEEMKPELFDIDKIPYDLMWDTDQHWIPYILSGQKIFGRFLFEYINGQEITKEYFIEPKPN